MNLIVSQKKTIQVIQKIGHTLLLIIGLYVAIVLAFYTIPAIWSILKFFFSFEWLDIFYNIGNLLKSGFFVILFGVFFGLTSTLFLFLPIAIIWLYSFAFIKTYRFKIPYGDIMIASTLGVNILLFIFLNGEQPQVSTFQLLEGEMNKAEFYQKENAIKKGLLNAYLSSYRYLSSDEESNSIKELYKKCF